MGWKRTWTTVGLGGISLAIILAAVAVIMRRGEDEILANYREDAEYAGLAIEYPFNGTVFPPDLVPPTFRWKDGSGSDTWLVTFRFQRGGRMSFRAQRPEWTPSDEAWETIKRRSMESDADTAILGVRATAPATILSGGRITIRTSRDKVEAPIFYREVKPPFKSAALTLTNIVWRFGTVSRKEQPRAVLRGMMVCANCHSFSADGRILGMDVDYKDDKGAYGILPVEKTMVLNKEKIISWSDYRREDNERTFGVLSAVSPDGRHVISTVKDISLSILKPEIRFSLRFFPVQGILAVYNRDTKKFSALPGACNQLYVQTNPAWSPDGKTIVFARTRARQSSRPIESDTPFIILDDISRRALFGAEPVLFDLYSMPFNDGKGGVAEPLSGASKNGKSNYFPKFSPDGKWLVFCQAAEGMLLEEDSQLYIMPAGGGTARRMRCNLPGMNSWHSWSPNGKWLVFASKVFSDYTQLFLTHIDEQGDSTPPVVLSHFNSPERAANIPEFVNTTPDMIEVIRNEF